MKDWDACDADEVKLLGQNYASGRPYGIDYITIHHMAGDLDADGCNRAWRASGASAHYSVDRDGVVCQHVWDGDRAYACGDGVGIGSGGNDRSISIEHANDGLNPWTVYPKALEEGAHLVAALCRLYGLGRPEWMGNVFPHKHWAATACPGELAGSQNAEYMARAQYWYDVMTGSKPSESAPAKPSGDKLTVDGLWGEDTTRALQRYFGTPVDGVVSSQNSYWQGANPGLTSGWEWVDNALGSQLMIAMQGKLGVEQDGLFGAKTANALIARYASKSKSVQDGKIDECSGTVKEMQRALNSGTF